MNKSTPNHSTDLAWECLRKACLVPPNIEGKHVTKTWHPSIRSFTRTDGCKDVANICIVTKDFFGPNRNGGIGTASTLLARGLAERGHAITVVYTLREIENGPLSKWVEHYKKLGITLLALPAPAIPRSRETRQPVEDARAVYEFLLPTHFDIVHFADWQGLGYYCLLAKKLGIAFPHTALCVTTHSPTQWNFDGNYSLVNDEDILLTSYFERQSVAWADIVLSPSQYMLQWYESQGWSIPAKKSFIQPHMLEPAQIPSNLPPKVVVKELVFFGRLERRKGLEIFIKTLHLLQNCGIHDVRVTLLGKFGKHTPPNAVHMAIRDLTPPVTILTEYNSKEAMAYLKTGGKLAVIPSLCDNSPMTICECLMEGIPFITSNVGGIPELIHKDDVDCVTCSPIPLKLAALLTHVLQEGAICPRAALDYRENADAIDIFHKRLAFAMEHAPEPILPEVSGSDAPLVSVCIIHKDRPEYLRQTLQGVESQTYRNFEVILVDDGSETTEAQKFLDDLAPTFSSRGWKIVRQQNSYAGAARNVAVKHALGEFVLLMDDDNVAKPHQIARFVQVALHNGADIVTCGKDYVTCEHYPCDEDIVERHFFTGGPAGYGFFINCFGDTNALIRRSTYIALGGFTEHYGIGRCDHEFFTRAALQGWNLITIPESLLWYRVGHLRLGDIHQPTVNAGLIRVLSAYANVLPPDMLDGLRLALGAYESIRKPVMPT
ncbi:Glycosyl transferase family 2 [anaerobic digester metagenome]